MNNEYLKLVIAAQNKRIKITEESVKQTRDLYKDVAKDLNKRARGTSKGSLNERWLKDYEKQLKSDIKGLNKSLKPNIESSMLKSAECANSIQMDFFNMLGMKYNLSTKGSFSSMFSSIPKGALSELTNGGFYKDGKGLSQRLWTHNGKANADFDYIIQKGLAEKKSTYDLANDLAAYVNPEVKKSWDFKKIYPGIGNKKVEYNSLRLAITSVSHAYQLSLQRSCKANPFVEGIQWNISNSHRGTCSLCQGRDGLIYKPDDLPLDHPMGVCYFTPVIEKSMEEVGEELNGWVNGGSNSKLESWYNEHGREFAGGKYESLGYVSQAQKHDKKINITDIAIDKVSNLKIPGFTVAQNLLLQQKHKELLMIAKDKNNSNEVLNILTTDFERESITLGSETGVNPSQNPESVSLMRTAKEKSIIWIHNHPKGSTFSYTDIGQFLKPQFKSITVVTNSGKIFVLNKKESFDFTSLYGNIKIVKEKYGGVVTDDTHDSIVKEILKDIEKYGVNYIK